MSFTLTLVKLLLQPPKASFDSVWGGMTCMHGKLAECQPQRTKCPKGNQFLGMFLKC